MLEEFLKIQPKVMAHVEEFKSIWGLLTSSERSRLAKRHGFAEYISAADIVRFYPEAASTLLGSLLEALPNSPAPTPFLTEAYWLNAEMLS